MFFSWSSKTIGLIRLISDNPKFRIPRCEVVLSAPIVGMDKVICIGMNYKDHCEEQNAPVPTEPVVNYNIN